MSPRDPINLLLVEDDEADAGLVRRALRPLGGRFRVTRQASLADGLAWLAGNDCQVVLLDLGLPDSVGLDTLLRVRQAAESLPIIVLTGHDDEDLALAALEAGAQDYLVKGAADGPALERAIRHAMARMHLEDRLRRSERRLQSIVTLAHDAILSVDRDHRIILFNPAAERTFGYTAAEALGMPMAMLLPERLRPDHDRYLDRYATMGPASRSLNDRPREFVARHKDGHEFPIEVSVSKDAEGSFPLTATVRDVTERRKLEEQLRLLAATDPLTGLPNRRAFLETAGRELAGAGRRNRPVALVMLDIDHFKRVNDRHGHAAGDEALRRVAETCRDSLRAGDLAGRLGGEEFCLLLPDTDLPAAAGVAERVRQTVAATPIPLPDGAVLHLTISLGVAIAQAPESPGALDDTLGRADRALYRAKDNGRDRVELDGGPVALAAAG